MRESTTPNTTEQQQQFFDEAYESAQQIDEQNNRHDTLMQDESFTENTAVRSIAHSGLLWEQVSTVEKLRRIEDEPYEMIGVRFNGADLALAAIQQQIDTLEPFDVEAYSQLGVAVEQAVELSPTVEDMLREHHASHPLTVHYKHLTELQKTAAQHEENLDELAGLFAAAARPWPLPQIPEILEAENTAEEEPAPAPEDEPAHEEDVFPADRHEHESSERIGRMVERHGHTVNASIMAAVELIAHAGEVLTPLELGQEVYKDSAELDAMEPDQAEFVMHTRILTLLNDKISRVPGFLSEEGHRLVYGDRYTVTATGKRIGNARRVYMAVPTEDHSYTSNRFVEEAHLDGTIAAPSRPTKDGVHESEEAVTEAEIDAIEKTIETLSKHDKWSARVDEYIEKAERLLPWLEDNELLPGKAGGRVNAMRIKMKFLNKKFGLSAPIELTQTAPSFAVGTQLKFSQVIYTLIPEDENRGIPAKYAKSIDRRVGELERLHYEKPEAADAQEQTLN